MTKLGAVQSAEDVQLPLPQVFVRTFTTPPGLPWDQARAAQLEARHGSPLPIADLVSRIRRLGRWSPAGIGRYAVFYVRRRDYTQPFETTVDVDGEPMRVAFGSTGERLQRAKAIGVAAAAMVIACGALALPVSLALQARGEAEAQLALVEQRAAAKARQAERTERDRLRSQALLRAQGNAGLPAGVLADLTWLSQARSPEARIVAVHWDHGLIAIESRGDKPPLEPLDRRMVRSDAPVRPGVWLWGLSRGGEGVEASAPVAAGFVE